MQENYVEVIIKERGKIILFGIAAAIIAGAFSFLLPLRYGASMRLLIIQKQLAQDDPYTATRASERISDNLGQIIYTTSFFDKVMAQKFNIDQSESVFSNEENKRRQQWGEMIGTSVVRGSGMLAISVYHTDPEQALQISRAIAFVLTTEGWQYVGGPDLQIKLVDEPLRSKYPVKPNIPANAFTGFVLGMLAGSFYVVANRSDLGVFG